MLSIVKCILGFTFFVIQFSENPMRSEVISGCDVEFNTLGRLVANCSDKGIEHIPQNFSSKIEILDVSNNSNLSLNNDDLKNYPNLYGFVIRNQSKVEFPPEFFKPVVNLIMLNLSKVGVVNNLSVVPSTIKILNFTYSEMQSIDIPHLHAIEVVLLRDCKYLHKIPSIPKDAPLRVLDMRHCPLTNANYSSLAPFCTLHYFGLNSDDLKEAGQVLKCCGFREWARTRKIAGTGLMKCFANETHPSCLEYKIVFDEAAVKEYARCYSREGTEQFIVLIIILAVTLIICTAVVGTIIYLIHRSHQHHPKPPISSTRIASEPDTNIEPTRNSEYQEDIQT